MPVSKLPDDVGGQWIDTWPPPTLEGMLSVLRKSGWLVAVHNDYRAKSSTEVYTFWLFTREFSTGKLTRGHFVKGEGVTDGAAVLMVLNEIACAYAGGKNGGNHSINCRCELDGLIR